MKCLLHIGTEKTGTTVLQEWLYSNQKVLSSNGVYLSNNLGKTNNRLFPAFFQNKLDDWAKIKKISSLEEKESYFSNFAADFSTEVARAKSKHKVFVITSEHLHSRIRSKEEVEALHDFLVSNFDEVEVVCYFRNQFDVVVSLYSTALKASSSVLLDSFLKSAKPENYYYNYAKIADLWSTTFGRECCNFRLYQRNTFIEEDIRKDFLSAVDPNLNFEIFDYSISSSNESMSLLKGAAYRAVNDSIPFWVENNGGRNMFNMLVKTKLNALSELNVGRIESPAKGEILEKFRETNDYFFKTYFNCENLFLESSESRLSVNNVPIEQVELIVEAVTKTVLDLVVTKNNSKLNNIADALKNFRLSTSKRPKLRSLTRKQVKEWFELFQHFFRK